MAVSIIIVLFLLFVEIFGVKYIKESQNVLNYQFTKILKGFVAFLLYLVIFMLHMIMNVNFGLGVLLLLQ